MTSARPALSSLSVLLGTCCWAQSGITVVGAGYSNPDVLRAAPGQVTTITFTGSPAVLPISPPASAIQRAAQVPLPTSLAGFSAAISQPGIVERLAIFAVQQSNECVAPGNSSPDCIVTAITVQIPFDLIVDYGRLSAFAHTTTIVISDGTGASKSFYVLLIDQRFHILTDCDATVPNPVPADFPAACEGFITHADGTMVSQLNPAHIGEELVMYAYGMGLTSPRVSAGVPTPTPAPTVIDPAAVEFAYTSGTISAESATRSKPQNPVFVGLAPGQIGLYQVNFIVEAPTGPVADCNTMGAVGDANLTLILASRSWPSSDSARELAARFQDPPNFPQRGVHLRDGTQ